MLQILRSEDDGQHSKVDRWLALPWTIVPTKMLRKTNAPSQTQETTKVVTTKEGRPAAALRSVYTTCVPNGQYPLAARESRARSSTSGIVAAHMPLVQRQQLEQRGERMVERRELLGEEDLAALAV